MNRRVIFAVISLASWLNFDVTYLKAATPPTAASLEKEWPYCGDGTCQSETCDPQLPGSHADGCEETTENCSTDCGSCGDGVCQDLWENYVTCYEDCPLGEDFFPDPSLDYRYPNDGFDWPNITGPIGAAAGDCVGNCGAGCSDFFNPCGVIGPTSGQHQYWELTEDTTPQFLEGEGNFCMDGDIFHGNFSGWVAELTWTYHGSWAIGCFTHDTVCPEWTWLGCLIFVGCGDLHAETWSYSFHQGWGGSLSNVEYVGSGSGVCDTEEPSLPVIR